jgi:murein peptide amidase A
MISPEAAHHPSSIFRRARAATRTLGLVPRTLTRAAGYLIPWFHSPSSAKGLPRILLSAGIHGDEPAGPEALLQLLEHSPQPLRHFDLTLFPCLNPWGLKNNSRTDSRGHDLNRAYARPRISPVTEARAVLRQRGPFDLAICLHEDYDAEGFYLYEISHHLPPWGRTILKKTSTVLAPDLRAKIDGRANDQGLITRKVTPSFLKKIAHRGLPEAIYLHVHHAARCYTFESPSEFSLEQRVAAHVQAIHTALSLLTKSVKPRA